MDSDKQFHSLIKLVSNVMEAYTAALFWLDSDTNELTIRNVYTMSKTLCRDIRIEAGTGIIGWVLRNGKAINASPFKRDPKTLQLYTEEENIKSFLAVPVMVGKQAMGVLCVDSKKGFYFTTQMEKILHGFADYFSQLIQSDAELKIIKEQANSYVHLYNLYRELQGFHNDNIFDFLLNISRQLFKFDNCILSILDESQQKLKVKMVSSDGEIVIAEQNFPSQDGITGLILRTKKPLLLTDLQSRSTPFFIFEQNEPIKDIGSFMGVPLLVEDIVIGFLGFTSKGPKTFGERDLQVASVLSFQASSNISLAKAHERTRQMEKIDGLTGLVTHSFFHFYLEQAFKEADKHNPFSLLLLDMDVFHQLNQKYGYQIGDELLKKVSQILLQMVRDEDVVARFAGEEFCILLRNNRRSQALLIAERIRHTIQQTVFLIKGIEIKLTVSIGLASYLEDALSKDELLHCAKSALDTAQNKRNTVCNFSER
ncbi:MAG: diguanylate cyclase [Candidatus Schekmanbacteria bacterium]|nr:diguanylate cyclase [Candidatus Schekmanbacteria bacterium]